MLSSLGALLLDPTGGCAPRPPHFRLVLCTCHGSPSFGKSWIHRWCICHTFSTYEVLEVLVLLSNIVQPVASLPPTTMALSPPILTSYPPHFAPPPPRKQFLDIVNAISCVFSVNFGSCQSEIMTPKNKKI